MTRFRAGTLFLLYAILWLAGCGGTPQDAATGEPYTSPSGTFTLTLPAGAKADTEQDPRCGNGPPCWTADDFVIHIEEAHVGNVADVAEYVEIMLPDLLAISPGVELIDQANASTVSGLPALRTEVTRQNGQVRAYDQWVVANGELLRLTFTGLADGFETIRPAAEAMFASVAVVQ